MFYNTLNKYIVYCIIAFTCTCIKCIVLYYYDRNLELIKVLFGVKEYY